MERERATKFIHELLDLLYKQKGSDLFITAGFPRIAGEAGRFSAERHDKAPRTVGRTVHLAPTKEG